MGAYREDDPNTWLSCIPVTSVGCVNDAQIKEIFANDERILATLDKDTGISREECLLEIYRKLRPGDPPTVESSESLLHGLFFDRRRYNISAVGRYKFNKKLALRPRIAGFELAEPVVDPLHRRDPRRGRRDDHRDEAPQIDDRRRCGRLARPRRARTSRSSPTAWSI